ncbi:hypothetical protein GCM10025857_34930 [Alicyclobacillus contaminans]|uniref:hypothetical protein n=1 Tax=Alicyclobacillus contaminans TaxID=392016 RepID=UPI000406DE0B|nr:hypothetical protein [Alicyclobacillus contaminans]GMA52136.1 hypothetical protein GCM10025857_34930 [Alicyclobacillus contaminans]
MTAMSEWARRAKTGAAAALFIALMIGGCSAAFSMFAEAMRALSGWTGSVPVSVQHSDASTTGRTTSVLMGSEGTGGLAGGAAASGGDQGGGGGLGGASVATAASAIDVLNERMDRMYSPVQHALDEGGVLLGDQVQQSFGQVLAGVLQTLFVEQLPGTAEGSGQP